MLGIHFMSTKQGILAVAVAVSVFSVTFAMTPLRANEGVSLQADNPAYVSEGAGIYTEHCAQCHGDRLEGQSNWRQRKPDGRLPAPPHDETGHTWHHPDQTLFELTKFGPARLVGGEYRSDMPGYEGVLTDQQIIAVLSYIKSRWPNDIRRRHNQLNR
jgi:mono/diheme cytochrome c family protein